MILSGWGRYPRVDVRSLQARGPAEALAIIGKEDSLIARGNGRAYGDPALNQRATLSMTPSDRLLAFDADSGVLFAEAGVLLADIIDVFLPRGWFVPVTPGTKFVTLGGMIAADVHGKNHHVAGSLASHLLTLDLALADGQVVRCSHNENHELFAATCGGMGLTGVILAASLRLIPVETSSIRQETRRATHLAATMEQFEQSQGWTYSVAWIDCLARGSRLGRSLIYLGEHARSAEVPRDLAAPRKSERNRAASRWTSQRSPSTAGASRLSMNCIIGAPNPDRRSSTTTLISIHWMRCWNGTASTGGPVSCNTNV